MNPSEQTLYLSSREDDMLRIVDIASASATSISLDATPGVPDRPDSVAARGDNVWVTLKSTGKLARYKANQGTVEYIELEDPCPGALPPPTNPTTATPCTASTEATEHRALNEIPPAWRRGADSEVGVDTVTPTGEDSPCYRDGGGRKS